MPLKSDYTTLRRGIRDLVLPVNNSDQQTNNGHARFFTLEKYLLLADSISGSSPALDVVP